MARFVRINTLSLKVENAMLGDVSDFKNRSDCDNWINSDTAKLNDTYNVGTGTFTSPSAYPEDGKVYVWSESDQSWDEVE